MNNNNGRGALGLILIILIALVICTAGRGQDVVQIPKGPHWVMHNGGTLLVAWSPREYVLAKYSVEVPGTYVSISYHKPVPGSSRQERILRYPTEVASFDNIENSSEWMKFLDKAKKEVADVDTLGLEFEAQVDVQYYVFNGYSAPIIDMFELVENERQMVFQDGDKNLVVAESKWLGPLPELHSKVHVAHERRGRVFFAARQIEGKWKPVHPWELANPRASSESSVENSLSFHTKSGKDVPYRYEYGN